MLTALVVDDEAEARREIADLLRLGGWQVREESAAAGAEACLVKPVGPEVLMNFLHNRATGAVVQGQLAPITEVDDLHDGDVEADLADRLRDMYVAALPARVSAITAGARFGNTRAVVAAADSLAGTSGQLGHSDVAAVCQAIAADARRGVMAHAKVVELQELARA